MLFAYCIRAARAKASSPSSRKTPRSAAAEMTSRSPRSTSRRSRYMSQRQVYSDGSYARSVNSPSSNRSAPMNSATAGTSTLLPSSSTSSTLVAGASGANRTNRPAPSAFSACPVPEKASTTRAPSSRKPHRVSKAVRTGAERSRVSPRTSASTSSASVATDPDDDGAPGPVGCSSRSTAPTISCEIVCSVVVGGGASGGGWSGPAPASTGSRASHASSSEVIRASGTWLTRTWRFAAAIRRVISACSRFLSGRGRTTRADSPSTEPLSTVSANAPRRPSRRVSVYTARNPAAAASGSGISNEGLPSVQAKKMSTASSRSLSTSLGKRSLPVMPCIWRPWAAVRQASETNTTCGIPDLRASAALPSTLTDSWASSGDSESSQYSPRRRLTPWPAK